MSNVQIMVILGLAIFFGMIQAVIVVAMRQDRRLMTISLTAVSLVEALAICGYLAYALMV